MMSITNTRHTWIIQAILITLAGMSILLVGTRPARAIPSTGDLASAVEEDSLYLVENWPVSALLADTTSGAGGDVLLSTRSGYDDTPAVAYNSHAHEFLVVWRCTGDICGQLYDLQGVPKGESFPISEPNPGYQCNPSVAYSLTNDNYLVVWDDMRNAKDYDIYGQRVDADGSLMNANFVIYTGNGNQEYPDVTSDGNNFMVVWQGNYADDSVDIAGRFVYASGVMKDTVVIAATGGTSRQEPEIAWNEQAGEYLVVFQYGDGAQLDICARRLDGNANAVGNEYTIANQADSLLPELVATPWGTTGGYLVVWSDNRSGNYDIYGRVVLAESDNTFDGADFAICTDEAEQTKPVVARSPSSGQFLVAWVDFREFSASGFAIFARRLASNADPLGADFPINNVNGDPYDLAIASSQDPDVYFVVWNDFRLGYDTDIYGQRVAWTGSPLWYEFAISAQPEAQSLPAVAYSEDQYLAVWQDQSSGHSAITAQRLSSDGQPLESPWVLEDDGHDNLEPDVIYNPDRDEYLVVWADTTTNQIEGRKVYLGGSATVWISVVDSAGGRHPRLAYSQPDHHYLVAWDAGGDVYAHLLEWDGLSIGGDSAVLAGGAGSQDYPAVAYDSDRQRFLVVWQDDIYGAERIYGQLVDGSGDLVDITFPIAGGPDSLPRTRPAVAYGSTLDKYLVVYACNTTAQVAEIRGRLASSLGGTSGDEIIIRDQPASSNHVSPDVAYAVEASRYFVIWSELQGDTDSYDLYGRWLGDSGELATGALPFFRYYGNQKYPRIAHDPDLQQGLVVWEDTRSGEHSEVYARLGALDTTPPTARFLRDPVAGIVGDTFTFDARPSSDDLTPSGALLVRWDWTSDGNWDTAWDLDKVVTRTIQTAGVYTVSLQVRDLMWYTADISLPVVVFAASINTPPNAAITVNPADGAVGTSFQFDASHSTDLQTPAANLVVRWDWENDGIPDTAWSTSKNATHSYTVAGLHTARVEVRDAQGLTDAATVNLLVQAGAIVTLEVNPAAVTVAPMEVVSFQATGIDANGNEITNPTVTWSVANPLAGTIDASGVFTASLTAGTYQDVIQVQSGAVSDAASVIIFWPYQVYLPMGMRGP